MQCYFTCKTKPDKLRLPSLFLQGGDVNRKVDRGGLYEKLQVK